MSERLRRRFRNPLPRAGRLRALATPPAPRAPSDRSHTHAPTPLTTTSLSSVTVMVIQYNTRALIKEVKERPALWNQQCDEYCDREFKKKCWEDVAQALNHQKRLRPRERIRLGIFFQRKWKCIRGCYTRELLRRRAVISGRNPTKRKTEYRYFKYLTFLEAAKPNKEQARESAASSINIIPLQPRPVLEEIPRVQQVRAANVVEAWFERQNDCEDMTYLKSLLPLFLKLSEDDKSEMKKNILILFKRKIQDRTQPPGLLKRFINWLLSFCKTKLLP